MQNLTWQDAQFNLNDKLSVSIPNLTLKAHDLLVLIGSNGCGKTSIAKALAGKLECCGGTAPQKLKCALVSFEQQQALFEADYNLRNTDAANAKEEKGITVSDLLAEADPKIFDRVKQAFNIDPIFDKPIRFISGGEGRRALLAQAVSTHPDLLVLDTPYDALDLQTRAGLKEIISYLHQNTDLPIVLIINRPDEIPDSLTQMGLISNLKIVSIDSRENLEKNPDAKALLQSAKLPDLVLPRTPAGCALPTLKPGPIISLKHINITYDRPVLKDLTFTVNPGEHWQIIGPNGAGKSTLLSLITGDNPLVYVNDVTVFGFKRGNGESIWDIKKYFGVVSGALHLDYRVSAPVINVVLSGFYDSIGLYCHPGDDEIAAARAWLKLAGLGDKEQVSFKQLSFGQQRLLLIVRALVKNPPLLILDEPLQGLDTYARALVKAFITYIIKHGRTSVLFVSHHPEDTPNGITNTLTFVSDGKGGYTIEQKKL